jgi:hypothetical protein
MQVMNGVFMIYFAFILLFIFPVTSFSSSTTSYTYTNGQAFKESKAMFSDTNINNTESESTLFMKDVNGFGAKEYFIWTGNLIKHGKNVRKAQNIIHDNLSVLGTGGLLDEKPAKETLVKIFDLHKSISNYEKDVYDFVNVASISGINEKSSMITPLMALLRDIKDNENNTYLLASSIINNVSADKVSKESLDISRKSMKLSEDSVKLARGANIIAVVSIVFTAITSFRRQKQKRKRNANPVKFQPPAATD